MRKVRWNRVLTFTFLVAVVVLLGGSEEARSQFEKPDPVLGCSECGVLIMVVNGETYVFDPFCVEPDGFPDAGYADCDVQGDYCIQEDHCYYV